MSGRLFVSSKLIVFFFSIDENLWACMCMWPIYFVHEFLGIMNEAFDIYALLFNHMGLILILILISGCGSLSLT